MQGAIACDGPFGRAEEYSPSKRLGKDPSLCRSTLTGACRSGGAKQRRILKLKPGTRWCPVIGDYAELLLGRSLPDGAAGLTQSRGDAEKAAAPSAASREAFLSRAAICHFRASPVEEMSQTCGEIHPSPAAGRIGQ
jgi:hypothetical protein